MMEPSTVPLVRCPECRAYVPPAPVGCIRCEYRGESRKRPWWNDQPKENIARYDDYSDFQIYGSVCHYYPAMVEAFDKLSQLIVLHGWSEKRVLDSFREENDEEFRAMLESDGRFMWKLLMRAIRHPVAQLKRARSCAKHN